MLRASDVRMAVQGQAVKRDLRASDGYAGGKAKDHSAATLRLCASGPGNTKLYICSGASKA